MSTINWFENASFDLVELKSPQPCIHGAGCVFTVKNDEGIVSPGCCRYVHPGEEGTGRRLFPAKNGKPACVRLTGNAGFYERRRLRLPWSEWCSLKGIPYKRNEPGVRHEPVKRVPFDSKKPRVALTLVQEMQQEQAAVIFRVETEEEAAEIRNRALNVSPVEMKTMLTVGTPEAFTVSLRVANDEEVAALKAAMETMSV